LYTSVDHYKKIPVSTASLTDRLLFPCFIL
jgi:hypothetical protein